MKWERQMGIEVYSEIEDGENEIRVCDVTL